MSTDGPAGTLSPVTEATSGDGGFEQPDPSSESRERFDPGEDAGKLIHSEHLARYQWAAQVAKGRTLLDAGCGTGYGLEILLDAGPTKLTAVDISEAAVRHSRSYVGERAEVMQADARDLPYSDGCFDLIVCFEVIEHIEDADRALAEFARVLREDGTLLISSPNPRIYLPGNPHHVHEFTPEELRSALGAHFEHVQIGKQQAWLGSMISRVQPQASAPPAGGGVDPAVSVATLRRSDSEDEGTFVVAAAGHQAVSLPDPRLVLGDPFEVAWWLEQVENAGAAAGAEAEARAAAAERSAAEAAGHAAGATRRLLDLERRLFELDQDYARIAAEHAVDRQHAAESAKQVEILEEQRAVTSELLSRSRRTVADLTESASWRITIPLRIVKHVAKQVRQRRT